MAEQDTNDGFIEVNETDASQFRLLAICAPQLCGQSERDLFAGFLTVDYLDPDSGEAMNLLSQSHADGLIVDLDLLSPQLFQAVERKAVEEGLHVLFVTSALPAEVSEAIDRPISYALRSNALSVGIEKFKYLFNAKASLSQKHPPSVLANSDAVVQAIAKDLHDSVGGLLSSMMLILFTQKEAVASGELDQDRLVAQLSQLEDLVENTAEEIRRICKQHQT